MCGPVRFCAWGRRFCTLGGFPGVRRPSAHDVFHFPDWALLLVHQHVGGGHRGFRGVPRHAVHVPSRHGLQLIPEEARKGGTSKHCL